MKSIIFALLTLFLCSELHSQEIRYVRDVLYVPLRSGQTLQHRIIHKGLISGTRVTVLETSVESGRSRVRTDKGLEGWIQTQYLSPEPAGRDLFKKAQQSLAELKKQNTDLKQQLAKLNTQDQQSRETIKQLTAQSSKMDNELNQIKSISANAITLNSDNKKLLEENQRLKNQLDILTADNQNLQDNSENEAFLNGAFAVLIGVMLTLLVPRLWPKKSSEWA